MKNIFIFFIQSRIGNKKPHTISTLFSCFPGSDEIRQRNTAHVRISGPASFVSKALKPDIIASISWTSVKENKVQPSLRNSATVQSTYQ